MMSETWGTVSDTTDDDDDDDDRDSSKEDFDSGSR